MFLGKTVPLGKTVLLDLSTWMHKQKGEGGGGGGVGWGGGLTAMDWHHILKSKARVFLSHITWLRRGTYFHIILINTCVILSLARKLTSVVFL